VSGALAGAGGALDRVRERAAGPTRAGALRENLGAHRRLDALTLAGLCAAGAALRAATIGAQSFDYDESFTVAIVHGSLGHVLHRIPVTESSPPLYYVLAWLWTRVFGIGPAGIRSLSVVFGTALIPVAFFVARRLGSPRAGLIAALLVAVNPFLVWYSEEARTYALLALLSALSFWAFIRAIDTPDPRRLALWAGVSAAAILSHYFAGFLVLPEAAWLIVATRRRGAVVASGAVAAVAAALTPLLISQADNRTQWIEALPLWARIKEVAKKWVTGEIAPTRIWLVVVVAVVVGALTLYAATRLTVSERRGVALALGAGGAALLIPLVLDLGGLHYLISKNVMPAMVVLLIGVAAILGAERARYAGAAGAAVAAAFFLAIAIYGEVDPAVQRPDYRSAASALGPPTSGQVVVTPNLGDAPMALYRPGAAPIPPGGWPTREVIVVDPLPRADVSSRRPATPPPPPGFVLLGRRDARTYTLICFGTPEPRAVTAAPLLGLAPGANVQVWPAAAGAGAAASPCASPH
jgi:mannosyltransferase